ncbi:unnamed protein product [Rhizoctonia solani]|uniref:holo-[acyl-carrier-protein] synthase n=1 Tax=Rhizoctonia solani TaxID=456999 RepID=A0A8H2XPF0_9AGAM|nr:unnamed protein product [Rhizoctonia solani]
MSSKEKEPLLHSWIITLGRQPTADEFSMCLRVLDPNSYERITNILDPEEAWKSLVGRLIPYVLMDQRRAPRTSWSLKETKYGKPYIDHGNDQKTIGYNITHAHNIVGMACAIGPKHKVWNIGIDAMRISPPTDMSVDDFIESLIHKLTPLELTFLDPSQTDEVKLRRLYILWTLKESYTKALGQPIGFDFSRIECDIPHRQIRVDGEPLLGWEFRLFRANTGVLRKGVLIEESYQCTTAIYRGGNVTKLLWEHDEGVGEGDKWLRNLERRKRWRLRPTANQNQNALLTELLGFVPQLLLDDLADAATDTVNNGIDGLEVYLRNEWLPKRTSSTPSQEDLEAEIDSGLLEFQTLLCGHRDMSIDMLEAWSMRNVFCVPPGLNIVMPHQKGLDMNTPQGKDVQMQVEMDVLRRKIENLKQAEQVTEHRLERSKARLERVKALQEMDPTQIEHLPAAYRSLLKTLSSLPTTTPPLPASTSTKKHTESRAEFLDWAVKRLVTTTTSGPFGKLDLLAQNVREDQEIGEDEVVPVGPPSTGPASASGAAGERAPGELSTIHEASFVDSEGSNGMSTIKRRRSSAAGGSKRRRSSMGLSERARVIGGELSVEAQEDGGPAEE